MSKKNARAGGKFTSSHSTVIPAAGVIVDIAHECSSVTKISLGFIKAGLRPAKGIKRVKIKCDESSLFLSVRDNTAQQELRVYATDVEGAKRSIRERAQEAGFIVSE